VLTESAMAGDSGGSFGFVSSPTDEQKTAQRLATREQIAEALYKRHRRGIRCSFRTASGVKVASAAK